MSILSWLIVGVGLSFALSVVVALTTAAILGQIGREVSELFENHHWASAPLARDSGDDLQQSRSPSPAMMSQPRS